MGTWIYKYDVDNYPEIAIEAWGTYLKNDKTLWELRLVIHSGYKIIGKQVYDTIDTMDIVSEPKKYFKVLKPFSLKRRNSTYTELPTKIDMEGNTKPTILQKFSSFLGMGGRKKPAQEEDIQEAYEAAIEAVNAITRKEKNRERPEKNAYRAKYKAKHEAKRRMKKRFKVGNRYILRIKPRDGSKEVITCFECKKFIYTMNDMPMNIVIMKQVYGEEGKKYTLDRHECQNFHMKFEPGLEVWPMSMNWIPEKKANV